MCSILSARIAVCQCRPGASLQITSGHVPPLKKKKKERENLSMQQIIADLIHIYMNMYKFKFFEKKKLIYLPQIFVLFDDDYYHGLNYNYFASEG